MRNFKILTEAENLQYEDSLTSKTFKRKLLLALGNGITAIGQVISLSLTIHDITMVLLAFLL